MSRIIAGDAKSIVLAVPSSGTRPTSDRVRESLFAVLESQGWLSPGDRILDLYCGTGALALEAVSRGASEAVLVDDSAAAIAIASRNCTRISDALSKLSPTPREVSLKTARAKVSAWLIRNGHLEFDLVFADPPYELTDKALWDQLGALSKSLRTDGLLVVERPRRRERTSCPDWLFEEFSRAWGDSEVTGYRLRSAGPT